MRGDRRTEKHPAPLNGFLREVIENSRCYRGSLDVSATLNEPPAVLDIMEETEEALDKAVQTAKRGWGALGFE